MTYDDPGNAQTSRAELFKKAYGQSRTEVEEGLTGDLIQASARDPSAGPLVHLSEGQLETVVDAVENARTAADRTAGDASGLPRDHGKDDEERLAILETQTRGLTRAGIAIAEMIQTVTPAGRALKAELPEADRRSAATEAASPPAKAG
jgi:hypothetical protein